MKVHYECTVYWNLFFLKIKNNNYLRKWDYVVCLTVSHCGYLPASSAHLKDRKTSPGKKRCNIFVISHQTEKIVPISQNC